MVHGVRTLEQKDIPLDDPDDQNGDRQIDQDRNAKDNCALYSVSPCIHCPPPDAQ